MIPNIVTPIIMPIKHGCGSNPKALLAVFLAIAILALFVWLIGLILAKIDDKNTTFMEYLTESAYSELLLVILGSELVFGVLLFLTAVILSWLS